MRSNQGICLGVALSLLCAVSGAHAGDAGRGAAQFTLCQTCHGTRAEGALVSNAPRLAGQHDWYVARQLMNFRSGVRGAHAKDTLGQQMAAMANTLPDSRAVEDVAAYVAGLTPGQSMPAPADAGDPARGKQHYAVCQSCHGAGGEGSATSQAPRLQGQHGWYLVAQLRKFRSAVRGSHAQDSYGQSMQAMSRILPDEQAVRDVVAYIGTFR